MLRFLTVLAAFAISSIALASPVITVPASSYFNSDSGQIFLQVSASDPTGPGPLTYTWELLSGPQTVTFYNNGTATSNFLGVYASAAGTYNFQVTVANANNETVTSATTFIIAPTISYLVVSPPTANISVGQTQLYTAVAYDQFSNPVQGAPIFWSASGGGTIDQTGLFTATARAGGSFAVTASSGSGSGSANVTIIPALTIVIASPADNSTFTIHSNVDVTAVTTVTGGTIANVQFFEDTISAGIVSAPPYTVTLTNLPVGLYALKAVATDNTGAQATAQITIRVPFEVVQIGALPSVQLVPNSILIHPNSNAKGINENDDVIGFSDICHITLPYDGTDSIAVPAPFLFSKGALTPYAVNGFQRIFPTSINNSGVAAGTVEQYDPGGINPDGSFRDPAHLSRSAASISAGGATPLPNLGTPPGVPNYNASGTPYQYPNAYRINDNGWIVGQSVNDQNVLRATLWKNGAPIDLGTLAGFESSAWDVNNNGQVVGQEVYSLQPHSQSFPLTHAYFWENGVLTDIHPPGGWQASIAHCITPSGKVLIETFEDFATVTFVAQRDDKGVGISPGWTRWITTPPWAHSFLLE